METDRDRGTWSRTLLIFLGALVVAASPSRGETVAVGSARPGFQAAVLCADEFGGGRVATLRRGTPVEVVRPGKSRFYLVRVPSDSGVSPASSAWAKGDRTGWLSAAFLVGMTSVTPTPTPGTAPTGPSPAGPAGAPATGGTTPAGSGAPGGMAILGVDGTGRGNPVTGPTTADAGVGGSSGISGTVPAADAAILPEADGGDLSLPLVQYVFYSVGDDEVYFESLCTGRGGDRRILEKLEQDAQNTLRDLGLGKRTYRRVVVRVEEATQHRTVLQQGLLPPEGAPAKAFYGMSELSPGSCRVLGFAFVSHAGCDGPLIPYYKKIKGVAKQLRFNWLQHDRGQPEGQSFYRRVVRRARIRYAGCNTGNGFMWYERPDLAPANPSIAHGTAFYLRDKDVVVFGKFNTGNVASDSYVWYSRPPGELFPTRQRYPRGEYRFWSTHKPQARRDIEISYSQPAERDALLAWYRSRGIPVQGSAAADSGKIVVRAPVPAVFTPTSPKPPLLVALVRDLAREAAGRAPWPADWDQRMPDLARLRQDPVVATAVRDALITAGNDPEAPGLQHDFRLWVSLLKPNQLHEVGLRADLGDDRNLQQPR